MPPDSIVMDWAGDLASMCGGTRKQAAAFFTLLAARLVDDTAGADAFCVRHLVDGFHRQHKVSMVGEVVGKWQEVNILVDGRSIGGWTFMPDVIDG